MVPLSCLGGCICSRDSLYRGTSLLLLVAWSCKKAECSEEACTWDASGEMGCLSLKAAHDRREHLRKTAEAVGRRKVREKGRDIGGKEGGTG